MQSIFVLTFILFLLSCFYGNILFKYVLFSFINILFSYRVKDLSNSDMRGQKISQHVNKFVFLVLDGVFLQVKPGVLWDWYESKKVFRFDREIMFYCQLSEP